MIRIGRVKDNTDPDKIGRIKVEVLPELQGIPDDKLPWACPVQMFDASKSFEQNIPEKNELVLVEVDETWTKFSYDGSRPFSTDKAGSESASGLMQKAGYTRNDKLPLHTKCLGGNVIIFEDPDKSKAGVVFKDGSYVLWTNVGNMFFNCQGKDGQDDSNTTIEMTPKEVKINGNNLVISK